MDTKQKEFGKIRSIIFPIYGHELKKFLPLTCIFFCISFNYALLRALKDVLVLTEMSATFLYNSKIYAVMTAAVLFNIVYGNLTKFMRRDGYFNVMLIYFIAFFTIFILFLLPNVDNPSFLLEGAETFCEKYFPKAIAGIGSVIHHWPRALFYIHAEMWGTFALGVLFWTFANEITTLKQSKRFYSFLSLGANVGTIIAGAALSGLFKGEFKMAVSTTIVFSVLCLVIYNWFSKNIQSNPTAYEIEPKPAKKEKVKLSFLQSLKFLAKSRYLVLIALMVLSYNICISLLEAVWKEYMKKYAAGNADTLANLYGEQLMSVGVVSIILTLFLSAPIMGRGWRFAASFTPVILLVGAGVFFAFLFDYLPAFITQPLQNLNLESLKLAVLIGLGSVVFAKAAKYTFFDPTKESAYIPLDEESKVRGKAAVDGIGSRLGKMLGSLLISSFFVPYLGDGKTIASASHYIALAIIVILAVWIVSVKNLGDLLQKVSDEKEPNK